MTQLLDYYYYTIDVQFLFEIVLFQKNFYYIGKRIRQYYLISNTNYMLN